MRKLTKDEHYNFVESWGIRCLGRWSLLAAVAQMAGKGPIDALHRHESLLAERLKDFSLRTINMAPYAKTYQLSPFFPPGTRGTEDRFRDFAKAIYHVWEPLVLAAQEASIAIDPLAKDECLGPINEIALLHACEDAIITSGLHVDRAGADETKLNDKKRKVLGKLAQAEQAMGGADYAAGGNDD